MKTGIFEGLGEKIKNTLNFAGYIEVDFPKKLRQTKVCKSSDARFTLCF